MKIRIKSGSLRYRLTRSEVELFDKTGVVEEKLHIGNDTLTYILKISFEDQLSASFKDNVITTSMPKSMAAEWVNTAAVGFSGETNGLHLLIEKDFTCLDNVEEDQSDNYPNPLAIHRS